MLRLSVIIPTHRRPTILKMCLDHLARQTIADQLEVIVVSDGNDNKTSRLFQKNTFHSPLSTLHFLEVAPCHQGQARNFGVQKASAPYILFIGDDILLAPDACEKHLETHRSTLHSPCAVLGFTTWDPAVGITPVMCWLETSGWQFDYPTLDRRIASGKGPIIPAKVQHRYTYTSHLSLPREIALKEPFRTDVHLYGWEDIEWGMRLRKAGVRLFYEPRARGLHHHHITMEQSLQRMETLGRSAVVMQHLVPGFDRLPRGWKLFLYHILSWIPTTEGRHRRAFIHGQKRTMEPHA
jgi:glycosyltransferase involved in cell wall biosynthesis